MTNLLTQLLHTLFVTGLALVGMAVMAVLLIATAVVLTVAYLVAKVRGKPFVPNAAWQRTQARWGFGASAERPRGFSSRIKRGDVVDVELREM